MKQTPTRKRKAESVVGQDDILPEYDFSEAAPNKHAPRFAAGPGRDGGGFRAGGGSKQGQGDAKREEAGE